MTWSRRSIKNFPDTLLVARHLGLKHHPVNLARGIRVRGAYHIQNVNAYDDRLKQRLLRFHGVAIGYRYDH